MLRVARARRPSYDPIYENLNLLQTSVRHRRDDDFGDEAAAANFQKIKKLKFRDSAMGNNSAAVYTATAGIA